MTSIMVVEEITLPKAPEAFRKYVNRFFKKASLMGKNVMVATLKSSWGHEDIRAGEPGIAPASHQDIRHFHEGLPKGMDLTQWIAQNEGRMFWRFTA